IFFSVTRLPPISTLFPYTTLFRSHSRLKLDSHELQGFALADPYAPFVFVNSEDWNAPQLFTLVHEIAHIWIAETGISNEIEPERSEEHTSELQSRENLVCRLLLEK